VAWSDGFHAQTEPTAVVSHGSQHQKLVRPPIIWRGLADGGHHRQPHAAGQHRERRSGWLQWAQVEELAAQMRAATGGSIALASVEQGYTGDAAAAAADGWRIWLEVIILPGAREELVLLPRRWMVERSFAWLSRFRRLDRDYERLLETVAGLRLVAFDTLMLVTVQA
jgi:transposase